MSEIIKTDLQRQITKRSNDLVYASYDLSAISQDILQCVISQIKDEDTHLNSYRFTIRDLEKRLTAGSGYERRIREKNLIKARKELMSAQIVFKSSNGTVDCFSWCSRFSYNISEKWIEVELHNSLNNYLINVVKNAKFTLVENKYFLPLKSAYSKRLYMILKNKLDIAVATNKKVGQYKTSVNNLTETLVIPDSFKSNFFDLKKRVLLVAMQQINEHTDIEIDFETEKEGRKVKNIIFSVKSKGFKKEKRAKKTYKKDYTSNPSSKSGVEALNEWLNKD